MIMIMIMIIIMIMIMIMIVIVIEILIMINMFSCVFQCLRSLSNMIREIPKPHLASQR